MLDGGLNKTSCSAGVNSPGRAMMLMIVHFNLVYYIQVCVGYVESNSEIVVHFFGHNPVSTRK